MARLLGSLARSRWAPLIAGAVLVALRFLPRTGLGLPLCMFRQLTGLPCPGCGLTRSMIVLAHGDLATAALMHPGGFPLFLLLVGLALLILTPAAGRRTVAGWFETHAAAVNRIAVGLGIAVALYGVGRLAWLWGSGQPSVW
jgi:hypothetical protein